MRSGRQKPFSHAQKKKQMKEKRARKRGDLPEPPVQEVKKEAPAKSKGNNTERRGTKLIKEIYGLQTVFAREEDSVVAERKFRAHNIVEQKGANRQSWEREALRPAHILGMPVRPAWDDATTKNQLETAESRAFAGWIKDVYARAQELQEAGHGELNFFEHNLDVWRQLWRSVEMGDCLLVCADVRWPTFTFPYALIDYAEELGKPVVLTLTKTDLVTANVAKQWEAYFQILYPKLTVALTHAFPMVEAASESDRVTRKGDQRPKALKSSPESKAAIIAACKAAIGWQGPTEDRPFLTMAAVGAPNAGKSAVINLLVEAHKVAVSATPGKTKHFQTHFIDPECRLLDSPGLMFPSVSPQCRVMQAIVGNYPVSQLREPFSAIAFLAARVNLPRLFGLKYPYDVDGEVPMHGAHDEQNHAWTSYEICEALAAKRGFKLKGGAFDVYRSGKSILAEALRGILKPVFWLPPTISGELAQIELI